MIAGVIAALLIAVAGVDLAANAERDTRPRIERPKPTRCLTLKAGPPEWAPCDRIKADGRVNE